MSTVHRIREWLAWYLDPVLLMMIGFTLVVVTYLILVWISA